MAGPSRSRSPPAAPGDLYPLPADIGPGWQFSASICVRAAPGLTPPPQLDLVLREHPAIDHRGPPLAAIEEQWQLLTVEGVIEEAAPTLVSLLVDAWSLPDGTCFLADDAVVIHLPP